MYLVDGYNLLYALQQQASDFPAEFRAARRRMVELLAEMGRREGTPVVIYFDGTPGVGGAPELTGLDARAVFTGGDADKALRDAVGDAPDVSKLIVVSSDREVARPSKDAGARIRSSKDIALRLLKLGGAGVPAGPGRGAFAATVSQEKAIPHALGKMENDMLAEVG
ncbi:MAG: NYN domain-containing protein, partial [Planctomycetaceae bacterium]|nr:NYN domain-containing protein [Planctomycetaceae bacterium]